MSVLDKIRGLNQLNAKRSVLKRALPGFTACWYARRSRQHHPESLGLTAGPAQTSEIKITAYPDFPYAVRVWTLIPLQFQSSLLTKYSYPTGKSCISSTYLRALASQEDFRCAVVFFGFKMVTLYSYPPAVPYKMHTSYHAPKLYSYIHVPAYPCCPHKLLHNTAC